MDTESEQKVVELQQKLDELYQILCVSKIRPENRHKTALMAAKAYLHANQRAVKIIRHVREEERSQLREVCQLRIQVQLLTEECVKLRQESYSFHNPPAPPKPKTTTPNPPTPLIPKSIMEDFRGGR